jgi:plasmid stability protein
MASITIRGLEDVIIECLRVRASRHGRFLEEEVRQILKAALSGNHTYKRRRGGRPIASSRGAAPATSNTADFEHCGITLFDPWNM